MPLGFCSCKAVENFVEILGVCLASSSSMSRGLMVSRVEVTIAFCVDKILEIGFSPSFLPFIGDNFSTVCFTYQYTIQNNNHFNVVTQNVSFLNQKPAVRHQYQHLLYRYRASFLEPIDTLTKNKSASNILVFATFPTLDVKT